MTSRGFLFTTCLTKETNRQCISDGWAQIDYTYNYAYCGQGYSQEEQDMGCSSEYQCQDWQNSNCVADGIQEQTRICTDQYGNSYQEVRQIADESCLCQIMETMGSCLGANLREYLFSYNYIYCGKPDPASETREDSICMLGGLVHSETTAASSEAGGVIPEVAGETVEVPAEQIGEEAKETGGAEQQPEVAGETIAVPEVGLSAKASLGIILLSKINLFLANKLGQSFILAVFLYPVALFLLGKSSRATRRDNFSL